MDFIRQNVGNIIVGVLIAVTLALVVFRLVRNAGKGKTGCGCGCGSEPVKRSPASDGKVSA
jgi:hypothetical protein